MTLSIANAQAIQACDNFVDACDLGTTNPQATLVVYSGTPPARVDASLSGNTVLAQLPMSNPAFGNATNISPGARATANAITDDTAADNTGTASFYRILDRNNVPRIQGTVGTSGADLNLNAVALVQNAKVQVSSLTCTMPEA